MMMPDDDPHRNALPPPAGAVRCCAGCGASEGSAGTLLLFEDPDDRDVGCGAARRREEER